MTRHAWIKDIHVRRQLGRVERVIGEAVRRPGIAPKFHRQVLGHRSKRLRAALLLLASRSALTEEQGVAERAAAGIELLHEATLYHDDVVDEAEVRRGEVTPHVEFGPRVAALAGSELLYASTALFTNLPCSLRRSAARTIAALCRGQLREIEAMADLSIRIRDRVHVMRDKTARLFALAAEIGGALGGADSETVRALVRFGLQFGMCYQLADDLRDLIASEESLGRPPGADLLDGVYTLPILFAANGENSTESHLQVLLHGMIRSRDPSDIPRCLALLWDTGAIERALGTFRDWMSLARVELARVVVASPGVGDSVAALLDWLDGQVAAGAGTVNLPAARSEQPHA